MLFFPYLLIHNNFFLNFCLFTFSCCFWWKSCLIQTFISSGTVCTSQMLCIVGACSFETDFCSWTSVGGGAFTWSRGGNQTATANTGPRFDHTVGNSGGKSLHTFHLSVCPSDIMIMMFWLENIWEGNYWICFTVNYRNILGKMLTLLSV